MAADQRKKKRVNATSLVGCTSHEKYRVNRKKLQLQQHDVNMRPNISLEWDSRKKSVVSKREQIGIARRHLIPFIEPSPRGHNILADVFPVPKEIFELEDLSEVLLYEVWQSHLSDNERSFLSQFLPKELEPDTTVRDLLSGDHFHFGNPFKRWGASLCSGKLHPDNVVHEEQSRKAIKKAYYLDLEKYHNDMIENLQMWKEKWSSCKDPDADIVQNIWSSRKHGQRSRPPSETIFCGTEENFVATPDSCSWANSEIAYSSENQNLGMVHGDSQRRSDFLKKISDSTSSGLKVAAAPKKGEKLHKWNIQHIDGAKYMSYIKVSREQHQRVKSSMKYAGGGIQPKSLNNVLGSFDALNVQPFARFEEEESKKLHEHWLKLATKDIPEDFANWRKRQFQGQELTQSLAEEIRQKVELQETTLDEEKEGSGSENNQMELSDDGEEEILPSTRVEGAVKEQTDDLLQEQKDNEEAIHEMAAEIEDEKEIRREYIFEEQAHDDTEMIENEDVPDHVFIQDHSEQQISSLNNSPRNTMVTSSSPGFIQDQHRQQISSLDSNPHTNSMEIESNGDSGSSKHEDPPIVSGYSGNMNHVDIALSQGNPLPSSNDVWPVGDVHGSYYQSTASNAGYASAQQLSIGHPQFIQEQAVRMLDLETQRQGKDAGKDMLHRQTDDMSFFSSYSSQDRSELLHSLFKGQSNLTYHQLQKHSGLEFQPGNDLVMEAAQFPGHFREHLHPSVPLDLRQKRLNDLYMHQNIQESLYSGGRFAMPRQDDLPVSIHDWATVNSVRMPASSQSHLNGGELSQNWYTGENGNRDGWPSLEAVGVNHSLNSGSNSDQTLFSVLSECNELPRASYDAMGSTERLIQAGNYSGIGGGIPSSSNFLQQSPNPLHYLSGHEASAGIKINNLGWMAMQQQNSGIQESIGKPFLRSWNQ